MAVQKASRAGAALMAALGDGLLADTGGVDTDASSLEAARWGTPSEQENLVPLRTHTLRVIRMGVDGPAPCTAQIWFVALAVGMLAGAMLGVTLLPAVQGLPISGGYFSCLCLMITRLFQKALLLLREEVAEEGHLARLLSSSVSPTCGKAVARISTGLRWLQGGFVLSQIVGYGYSLTLITVGVGVQLGMVVFFGGFVVGSFMFVSMILSIVCSCEVLDDCIKRLTAQATRATTMEQLRTVSLALRELDNDVQQTVVALRPTVLTVSAARWDKPRQRSVPY